MSKKINIHMQNSMQIRLQRKSKAIFLKEDHFRELQTSLLTMHYNSNTEQQKHMPSV